MYTKLNSVQDQNATTRERIMSTARAFQKEPLDHAWLYGALDEHNLSPNTGMLARWQKTPDQGGDYYEAVWLTQDGRFYRIAVCVTHHPITSVVCEGCVDVTDDLPVNAHTPGTGKSFGWLAHDVQRELLAGVVRLDSSVP